MNSIEWNFVKLQTRVKNFLHIFYHKSFLEGQGNFTVSMSNGMLIIRECGSTFLVGLIGIVQMLIRKSKKWKEM